MPRKPPCCVRPPRGRGVPAVPSPRRDRDVCASQSGGAINNDGGSLEVNRSFFGNNTAGGEGEAVLLSSSTDSAIISDSTFAKGNATYDDGDAFIFTNGVTIDYGTCTGGTNPVCCLTVPRPRQATVPYVL